MTLPNPRLIVGLVVALSLAGVGVALWPGAHPPPQELITRNIVKMVRAAEDREVSGVMEYVSASFRSDEGWTREEAKAVVAQQVLSRTWVRIFTTGLDVSVTSESTASMKGKFIFGRSDAQKLDELAKESVLSAYEIEGRLEKEQDGVWRFVWARHRQLPPGALF
ncbi:MAG: hypothetical protein ACYC8T_00550 [Myxococcaceae bacterium]